MEPIYKIGWRPLKQKDHRQLRTTAEEQYQKEQQRIELKKQQFSNLKDFREKMYYGSRNDKRQIWEKMNEELNEQRSVLVFIFGEIQGLILFKKNWQWQFLVSNLGSFNLVNFRFFRFWFLSFISAYLFYQILCYRNIVIYKIFPLEISTQMTVSEICRFELWNFYHTKLNKT